MTAFRKQQGKEGIFKLCISFSLKEKYYDSTVAYRVVYQSLRSLPRGMYLAPSISQRKGMLLPIRE